MRTKMASSYNKSKRQSTNGKEFDTYKFVDPDLPHIDTNSCSTMHKIAAKEFELDDFSHEHLVAGLPALKYIIDILNIARDTYLTSKNKEDWWQLIQLLPSSYNQRRTMTFSYETVVSMIKQRSGHKLDEWREFCTILKDLPYIEEITRDDDEQS